MGRERKRGGERDRGRESGRKRERLMKRDITRKAAERWQEIHSKRKRVEGRDRET